MPRARATSAICQAVGDPISAPATSYLAEGTLPPYALGPKEGYHDAHGNSSRERRSIRAEWRDAVMQSFPTRLVGSVARSLLLAPCLLICLACATPFPLDTLKEGMTMEQATEM